MASSAHSPGVGDRRWVTSWGTSMQCSSSEPVADLPCNTFSDQTLRLIVQPHVGGQRVRLRFSNRFQRHDLELGSAWIGHRDAGATIHSGDTHQITFSGKPSTTVYHGSVIVSDPLDFHSDAFEDLAISFHVTAPTSLDTHVRALQTSYLTPAGSGDHASSEVGDAFVESMSSWFCLDGVEVFTAASTIVVAAFGDSITDGMGTTPDINLRWPDQLAQRFSERFGPGRLAVVNAGTGGSQLTHTWEPSFMDVPELGRMWAAFGPSGASRLANDVLTRAGVDAIVQFLGGNDVALGGASSDRVIAGMSHVARRARAASLIVIGATLPPRGRWSVGRVDSDSRAGIDNWARVNDWIRTTDDYDDIVDFDLATRDAESPTVLFAPYNADGVHLTDAGNRAMADAFDLDSISTLDTRRSAPDA